MPRFFTLMGFNIGCNEQAYTHELEIKVSRLEEENERLRRQKVMSCILGLFGYTCIDCGY